MPSVLRQVALFQGVERSENISILIRTPASTSKVIGRRIPEANMQRARWIGLLSGMLTLSVPVLADVVTSYNITFMPNPGFVAPLPSGSFDFDSTMPAFSNFSVDFDGLSFDLTAAANNPTSQGGYPSCVGLDIGAQAAFDLLTTCAHSYYEVDLNTPPGTATFVFGAPLSACGLSGPCIDVGAGEFANSILTEPPVSSSGNFSVAPETAPVPEPGNSGLLLGAVMLLAFLTTKSRKARTADTTRQI